MIPPRLLTLTILSMFAIAACAGDSGAAAPDNSAVSISYEKADVPGHQAMGMMGIGLYQSLTPHLDIGVNSYAAVTGDLGGFITIGVGGRAHYPLGERVSLGAGLDVGAGGGRGGNTIVGGGLMLRGQLGLDYRLGRLGTVGAGVSRVQFPDHGIIHSTQPYVAYSYPFEGLYRPGWASDDPIPDASQLRGPGGRHEFSVVYRRAHVPSGLLNDKNTTPVAQDNFSVLGVEWRSFLSDHAFFDIGSEAAISGGSSGYMQILLGAGLVYPLTSRTIASVVVDAGAGGGGGVQTGGGGLVRIGADLKYLLSPQLYVDLSAGRLKSISAPFKASEIGLGVGYQFGPTQKATDESGAVVTHHLRLRLSEQIYVKAANNWRTDSVAPQNANKNVDNLGVQVDYFLSPNWFVTGQGFAAHHGDAGAYMTGLVGAGVRLPLVSNWSAEAEVVTGAAGGGGLAMGGGWLAQANLGLVYQFTSRLSGLLTLGEAKAVHGQFRAHVIGLGLAYHERLFERR